MSNQISVVIPSYKSEKTIVRTVESVLGQTGVDVEVIVVEDGHYDNTRDILSPYLNKIQLVTLESNKGGQYARNLGLLLCSHAYVMFLDSDDYLEGNLLLGLLNSIQQNGSDFAFGNCVTMSENDKKEKSFFIAPEKYTPIEALLHRLLGVKSPAPCSILWKTNSIKNIGGWNELYTTGQDIELIIRAVLNGLSVSTSHIGQGVYWQHEKTRVSKRCDSKAFDSHEKLYEYVKSSVQGTKDEKIILSALNYYVAKILTIAWRSNDKAIITKWTSRWKRIPPKISLLKYHGIKIFFLHTLYFIFDIQNTRKLIDRVKRIR